MRAEASLALTLQRAPFLSRRHPISWGINERRTSMEPSHRHFLRDNLLGISLTLIGLLCMAAVTITYIERSGHSRFASAEGKALEGPGIDALRTLNKAYEQIAQSMTPSIVSIQSTQVVKTQMSPFFSDPLFRQFFGPQSQVPREQREHALGSGVLVSSDGYIL